MVTHLTSTQIKHEIINYYHEVSNSPQEVEEHFVRIIHGYGKNENFFSKIFYRIWNAVKAIFGQSDWQIGMRAIKAFNVKKFSIQGVSKEQVPEELLPEFEKLANKITGYAIKSSLKALINLTYSKNLRSENEVIEQIVQMHNEIDNAVKSIYETNTNNFISKCISVNPEFDEWDTLSTNHTTRPVHVLDSSEDDPLSDEDPLSDDLYSDDESLDDEPNID